MIDLEVERDFLRQIVWKLTLSKLKREKTETFILYEAFHYESWWNWVKLRAWVSWWIFFLSKIKNPISRDFATFSLPTDHFESSVNGNLEHKMTYFIFLIKLKLILRSRSFRKSTLFKVLARIFSNCSGHIFSEKLCGAMSTWLTFCRSFAVGANIS